MKISLVKCSEQKQLNIREADAKQLRLAGGIGTQHLRHPRVGPFAKLVLLVKGKKVSLIWGGSNAIWGTHQAAYGGDASFFDRLWGALNVGDSVSVEVESVVFQAGAGNARKLEDLV